ncbi:MAG: hypothetical protein ACON5F_02260 [Jejuia sp.]
MKTISDIRAERIARNINAMDINYEYIDQFSKWKFWSELRGKLIKILCSLSQPDKDFIKSLCEQSKAKYFGLL